MLRFSALFSGRVLMARTPSIKFTHGLRNQIDAELKAAPAASIHPAVVAAVAPVAGGAQAGQPAQAGAAAAAVPLPASTVLVQGGQRTLVTRMPEGYHGNPFGKKSSLQFDDTTIALIELGGAVPDAPKPVAPAGDKKKK